MIFLISLAVVIVFIFLCRNKLIKHPITFYIISVLISVLISVCTVLLAWFNVKMPAFVADWIWPLFSRGGIAGALFIVVMITGALPNKSAPLKKLLPIRGQLSIIASIFTLGHNAAYGKVYFAKLFTAPSSLPTYQLLAAICSIIMLIIMIPLFITSFICVRKKMKASNWKKLQCFAYAFYALLCIHILLLTVPAAINGRSGYKLTVLIYGAIFLSYGICRIMKYVSVKSKKTEFLYKRQFISSISCFVVVFLFVLFINPNKPIDKDDIGTLTPTDGILEYKDGIFSGKGFGMNGYINVSVTIKDGCIVDILIDSSPDDEPYFTDAKSVIQEIILQGDTNIDTVSGATYSSGGIIDAVDDALSNALK